VFTLPEFSAEPISLSRLVKEAVLVELFELVLEVLDEELAESSRLVTLSNAVCALVRSPELIALKRLRTSWVSALVAESLVLESLVPLVDDVSAVELDAEVLGVAYVSRVVNALCAPAMLLSDSAVETLERNSPSGLLESAFEGASFSTSARYFLASVESPDLMADIRLVSAPSNEFPLLAEELEVDEVEDAASSEKRELLCKLEISMIIDPFAWISQTGFLKAAPAHG
jgi:hypothetical protein